MSAEPSPASLWTLGDALREIERLKHDVGRHIEISAVQATEIERLKAATPPDAETAAALLRSLGWSVVAPVDPQAAIPEPEVGQVWRSPKPRVEPRTVVGFETCWEELCVVYENPGSPELSRMRTDSWRAWARKSGARP